MKIFALGGRVSTYRFKFEPGPAVYEYFIFIRSMSDFPLLCRVLEDYSLDHHRVRINSIICNSNEQFEVSTQGYNDSVFSSPEHGTSSILETSTSTNTTTDQLPHDSNDYDVLDSVIKDIQSKTEPHPHTPTPENPDCEATEPNGIIKGSWSTNKLFDDPKYSHLSVSSEYDPTIVRPHPSESQGTATAIDSNQSPTTHSNIKDKVFDEKEFKEYMSLEHVLELVNSKMKENPKEADYDMLYSPRVLGPVQQK